jgi:hypothetical protein
LTVPAPPLHRQPLSSASQIGLRKGAAGQPRHNFEPTYSLAASFFRTKLVKKTVKTAKYYSVQLSPIF